MGHYAKSDVTKTDCKEPAAAEKQQSLPFQTKMSSSSKPSFPSKPSRKTQMEVLARRKMGLYISNETRAEAEVAFHHRQKGDIGFTIIHHAGVFNVYNQAEFLPQIKVWRDKGAVLLEHNVVPITICDKTAWLITIQPPKITADNSHNCPLAMAFNRLVSGFSYVMWEKSSADLVLRALEENTKKDAPIKKEGGIVILG